MQLRQMSQQLYAPSIVYDEEERMIDTVHQWFRAQRRKGVPEQHHYK